jgi:hypothetical protein
MRLAGVLDQVSAIEEETEKQVKAAVAAEDEIQRQGLNNASTRLHEVKTRLKFNVADGLSSKGLGPGAKILEGIQERMAYVRSIPKLTAGGVKFDRNALKAEPEPAEPSKETSSGGGAWVVRALVLGTASAVLVGGYLAWTHLSSRFVPNEIQGTIPISRILNEEYGVAVQVDVYDWDRLTEKAGTELFDKLEKFMREKKHRQLKIVDDNGNLLAALARLTAKETGRRVFRKDGKPTKGH